MGDRAGIGFAVAAGLGWATLDVLRKRLALRHAPVPLLWALMASQLPIFAAWTAATGHDVDLAAYAPAGAGVAVVNVVANLMFIRALQIGALSRTVPILSLTPVISMGAAALLLAEWPTMAESGGVALVVVGSLLLAVDRSVAGFRLEPGSLLMVGVAIAWALGIALDKIALRHAAVPAHALIQTTVAWAALSIHAARHGPSPHLSALGSRGVWAAAAVLAAASSLQYVAVERTLVSLVEAIKRAVGTGVAVALGRTLFGESIGWRTVGASSLLVIGTALVLLGGPSP